MIRKQKQLFYFVGDKPFASLEEAQKADLCSLMPEEWVSSTIEEHVVAPMITDWMLKNAKEIVDTLTTTPRSRLRARKLHGATRKPRAKKEAAPAEKK